MKNKDKYVTILLNIHGGGWMQGNKADVYETSKSPLYKDFIIATMSYTLVNGDYKEYNIFRIIDEITAVIKTLKQFLIKLGFNGNKLELILGGGSAGAHLSLLYSYMIKKPLIPIKFVLNFVAPVILDPDNFLTTKPDDQPLENIEPNNIKEAKEEGLIIPMNGSATGVEMRNIYLINFMNGWLGRPLNDSIDEIFSDIDKMIIDKTSDIYKELFNKTSYAYPINYVTKESIPTLCAYGGKDEYVGVAQYAKLKEAFMNKSNDNISLVYFKYGKHDAFYNNTGEYGKNTTAKFFEEYMNYLYKYLDSYKKNN